MRKRSFCTESFLCRGVYGEQQRCNPNPAFITFAFQKGYGLWFCATSCQACTQ